MQDILLPLLVFNLLLTFWLLRQHIIRQGRRHRRRKSLAEWQSYVDGRNKQFFEMLINHSEIFLEHRSAMAEINKDYYAINEMLKSDYTIVDGRLEKKEAMIYRSVQDSVVSLSNKVDALSVSHAQRSEDVNNFNSRLSDIESALRAGVKTGVSLSEHDSRLSSLESDIEAIKDIINPHGEKISYLESIVHTAKVHDNFSGRSLWETATLGAAVGDLRKEIESIKDIMDRVIDAEQRNTDFIAVIVPAVEAIKKDKSADHTLISLERRASKVELAIDSIETNIADFARRFSDLWALRNSHEMLSATVETLRIQHSGLAQDTSQAFSEVDNRINSHSRQIDTVSYWLCENTKFPEKVEPFNQDTLIDSLESDRQQETADPVGYANRQAHWIGNSSESRERDFEDEHDDHDFITPPLPKMQKNKPVADYTDNPPYSIIP